MTNAPTDTAFAASCPVLRIDEGQVIRIKNSRVSLDLIVEQYENGMTPEDLVRVYDTLVLADVYEVIALTLRHPAEVAAYLERRASEAGALKAKLESEHPPIGRKELAARRTVGETTHAPAGIRI